MGDIKLWGWNKKKRTMLRSIKAGGIFCFELDEKRYCFGRIIAECDVGHIAEIFDCTSTDTAISPDDIEKASRLTELVILDSYSLFDRKSEGEWRIVGHQENYTPVNVEGIYFAWDVGACCKKSDVFGNTMPISQEEWSLLPKLSPKGDGYVKQMLMNNKGAQTRDKMEEIKHGIIRQIQKEKRNAGEYSCRTGTGKQSGG